MTYHVSRQTRTAFDGKIVAIKYCIEDSDIHWYMTINFELLDSHPNHVKFVDQFMKICLMVGKLPGIFVTRATKIPLDRVSSTR